MAGEDERLPSQQTGRDPFDRTPSPEPSDDAAAIQAAIRAAVGGQVGKVRETKVRPSEKRRRRRQLSVTFTSEDIPRRIKALAERWGMYGPDGKRPNFSAVVEYLLLPQLEAAERGELDAPSG